MASVLVDGVTMRRGETTMLDAVTLDVPDRELLVVLGPSGAGKSALLRVVAGLEKPDLGRVIIDGADVTEADTAKRGVAMVFQDNALFPFMSVRDNVAFPLSVRNTPKDEVEARVLAESRVLEIQHLLDRMPGQLSAGHQQLVQAARALVRAPDLFLMDEPLARLDAHLRVLMRREIRLLQSGYGVTMLYVTNDPDEAMAMADRVAVLDHGRVLQVGPPLEVYRKPNARTVASVVGNPPMSFLPGKVTVDSPGFWIEVGPLRIRAWEPRLEAAIGPVDVGVRPDEVALDEGGVPGIVVRMEHHGASSLVDVEVAPGVVVPVRTEVPLPVGLRVSVALVAAHVFHRVTGTALGHADAGVT
jgi:ABC-type sugar transport system ATPase subunit